MYTVDRKIKLLTGELIELFGCYGGTEGESFGYFEVITQVYFERVCCLVHVTMHEDY